ncbi:hypothetical protein BVRB_2g028710 [Beta vulgaris subsp. vulgaris]|nr:hypothetical protein BVRB_2g028710 [Beta vulgaris subsp. vulgaris]
MAQKKKQEVVGMVCMVVVLIALTSSNGVANGQVQDCLNHVNEVLQLLENAEQGLLENPPGWTQDMVLSFLADEPSKLRQQCPQAVTQDPRLPARVSQECVDGVNKLMDDLPEAPKRYQDDNPIGTMQEIVKSLDKQYRFLRRHCAFFF